MKKKVLCINYTLSFGGAEKIFAFVANTLALEYDVHLMLLQNKQISLKINPLIKIHQYYYDMTLSYHNTSPLKVLSQIKEIKNAIRLLQKNEHYDFIMVFDEKLSAITHMALYKDNCKLIFSMRNDPNDKSWFVYNVLRYIYKKAYAVVYQLPEVKKIFKIRTATKQYIIPNPAFNRQSVEKSIKSINCKRYILGAGRFQYRKGFDVLLKAFKIVSEQDKELKLVLCGDGKERGNLEKLAKQLNIYDKVYFLGYINNVMQSYNDALMFVLPSRSEGIPNVLIEACLNKVPCVAADCTPGGARFLLNNGGCGILVNNDDIDDLANGIERYLNNPLLGEKKAEKGYEYMKNFLVDKVSAMWLKVFL